ncbi:DUF6332 family protein [Streptomyces spirodelae]|uniref:Uncharacterized protein n=1 Tax=Streptomyces spirodelae TaxID=2812904 RepID=A0ABS3WS65_9ACTN|nr:DUF6332 family protein [Streptomyces spirodelae]MBO8185965.1 hypothetical protein [Streptomyces spirodelae]
MTMRSQAERDAVTVEIGYALVTAVVLAVVAGLAVASPMWFLHLEGAAKEIVSRLSLVCAGGVLIWRLASVLIRYDSGRR